MSLSSRVAFRPATFLLTSSMPKIVKLSSKRCAQRARSSFDPVCQQSASQPSTVEPTSKAVGLPFDDASSSKPFAIADVSSDAPSPREARLSLRQKQFAALKATLEDEKNDNLPTPFDEGTDKMPAKAQPRLQPYQLAGKMRPIAPPIRTPNLTPSQKRRLRQGTASRGELLARLGREDVAEVLEGSTSVNGVDLAILIEQLGRQGNLKKASELLTWMENYPARSTPEANSTAYEALVAAYAKHGDLEQANQLHDRMLATGLVRSRNRTWHALILGYSQRGSAEDALRVYERMKQEGVKVDLLVSAAVVGVLARARGRKGRRKEAEALLEEAFSGGEIPPGQESVIVIEGCGRLKFLHWAERIFQSLQANSQTPSFAAYAAMLATYDRCGQSEAVVQTFWDMKEAGYQPGPAEWGTLIHTLCSKGDTEGARVALRKMQGGGVRPETGSYGSLVSALCAKGRAREAAAVLEEMQSVGCRPSGGVYSALVAAHAKEELWGEAIRVAKQMQMAGYGLDSVSGSALVMASAALACQGVSSRLDEAIRVASELERRKVLISRTAYESLVKALRAASGHAQAKALLQKLEQRRSRTDASALDTTRRGRRQGEATTDCGSEGGVGSCKSSRGDAVDERRPS